jgi:hypothetical protein
MKAAIVRRLKQTPALLPQIIDNHVHTLVERRGALDDFGEEELRPASPAAAFSRSRATNLFAASLLAV